MSDGVRAQRRAEDEARDPWITARSRRDRLKTDAQVIQFPPRPTATDAARTGRPGGRSALLRVRNILRRGRTACSTRSRSSDQSLPPPASNDQPRRGMGSQ